MFKAIEYQKYIVYLCTYKGLCAIFAKWKKECWGLYTVQKKVHLHAKAMGCRSRHH